MVETSLLILTINELLTARCVAIERGFSKNQCVYMYIVGPVEFHPNTNISETLGHFHNLNLLEASLLIITICFICLLKVQMKKENVCTILFEPLEVCSHEFYKFCFPLPIFAKNKLVKITLMQIYSEKLKMLKC